MRISKVAAGLAAAAALVVACNAGLSFMLTVHGSKSQVMWTDYARQDTLDTVYVGTSIAQRAFDPEAIDAELGWSSFNMSTPVQVLESMLTSIQTAYEDHGIKRAVVGLGYSNLQEAKAPDPGRTYYDERARVVSLQRTLATDAELLAMPDNFTGPTSLNWVFPWIHNKVELTPRAVLRNVRMKLRGTSVYDAAVKSDRKWVYYGKGYGNHDRTLNYDSSAVSLYDGDEDYRADFRDERLETLGRICSYCDERGIELVAVGVPLPDFYLMGYGEKYYEQAAQLAAFLGERGASYYDFNMATPELLALEPGCFADSEHLNRAGAVAFSQAFSKLMRMREAGEDMSGLFCDAAEREARLSYISALLVDSEGVDGGVRVRASALAGAGVEPEYRFWLEREGGRELLRDYAADGEFTFRPDARGSYRLRVDVRERGAGPAAGHHRVVKVLY